MVGEHALTARVASWTIATQARLGLLEEARAGLAMVTDRQLARGELCNAIATLRLAEHDPVAAQKALEPVLEGTAPVNPHLTLIEAHLLDALAHHELGDQSAAGAAVERALSLAEPDRLVLPFAMTGAWRLLETVLKGGTGVAHTVRRSPASSTPCTAMPGASTPTGTGPSRSARANSVCCATCRAT